MPIHHMKTKMRNHTVTETHDALESKLFGKLSMCGEGRTAYIRDGLLAITTTGDEFGDNLLLAQEFPLGPGANTRVDDFWFDVAKTDWDARCIWKYDLQTIIAGNLAFLGLGIGALAGTVHGLRLEGFTLSALQGTGQYAIVGTGIGLALGASLALGAAVPEIMKGRRRMRALEQQYGLRYGDDAYRAIKTL